MPKEGVRGRALCAAALAWALAAGCSDDEGAGGSAALRGRSPGPTETPEPSAEETPLLPFPLIPELEPTQSDPTPTPAPGEASAFAGETSYPEGPARRLGIDALALGLTASALVATYPSELEESAAIELSASTDWWLNSGGRAFFDAVSAGRTAQGELPFGDRWRLLYAASNPVDTDGGYHPQNIFRLVRRSRWQNFRQQAYFRLNSLNLSSSPNRNASNGFLLFHRYQDGQNLYYAGLRVDGAAVIKKKLAGRYTTLAYRSIYTESTPYDRAANPNLLPLGTWIGIQTAIVNEPSGTVSLDLFVDRPDDSIGFVPVLSATDTDSATSGPAIVQAGYVGMRIDFVDADFRSYAVTAASAEPTPTPPAVATPAGLTCGGRAVTRIGTAGNDTIRGTDGTDVIHGGGGNDVIDGLGGDDFLCGGDGRDQLNGGSGDDFLDGGPGSDRCRGGTGRNRRRACE